jgi:transaldolase / glucose-6-phosphate isomerase
MEVFEMSNRLVELAKLGQSVWLDNIQRKLIESGELKHLIDEDDLRGVTSNPTIFEKAITGSKDYDEQLKALITSGATVTQIYEAVVIEDISRAADVLKPVYERTKGVDGYISLEVNPKLAYSTQETIDEADRLFHTVGRKNVMIKIPASAEGIPAIEESIYRGININITMIFSIENYEQVAEAYIRGLERRAAEGKPVTGIASVASFFVSRIDTMVDTELEHLAAKVPISEEKKNWLLGLRGRAALANAKVAYQHYKAIFHGGRFDDLSALGAMVQRQLWASTGTKNPAYSDLLYVDNLVARETVNTVPPATLNAFRDHGIPALTIEDDLEKARQTIFDLEKAGIDMKAVTDKLQIDGLAAFVKSFESLEASIAAKRALITSGINDRLATSLSNYDGTVKEILSEAEKNQVAAKIWKKDASLWKSDPDSQKQILNSLGWLGVVELMNGRLGELTSLAQEISRSGQFTHVMVCGMGGSSLCPEVFRQTFGPQPGYPELLVLDSTDPDHIAAVRNRVEPEKCLFIIASKSGGTTEPNAFFEYWFDQVGQRTQTPGSNFIAITDPGTSLEKLAAEKGFRKTFLNPADIGGRYSALSYFGLVPAALMGLDVAQLLLRAEEASRLTAGAGTAEENPGVRLGATIGALAREGRDKLTLICDPKVASIGLWIEQLVAESTGKEGKGVLPVAGEPLGAVDKYGADRIFVNIAIGDVDAQVKAKLEELSRAGHPVIHLTLRDLNDLGEEFFLWEFATAVIGWSLRINPFDQPNVQEAKDATKALLQNYQQRGALDEQQAQLKEGRLTFYSASQQVDSSASALELLTSFLGGATAGKYIAFLDFIEASPEHDARVEEMRTSLRDSTRCATTAGYGPRYLHSTGQLHKGGPANGLFLMLEDTDRQDVPVPNEHYTFSILKHAQALGDFKALGDHGRRALRIDLGKDAAAGLEELATLIGHVCERLGQPEASVGTGAD